MTLKTVGTVNTGDELNFRGDLQVTGDISSGAVVNVTDGCVIIDGDVCENAHLTLVIGPTPWLATLAVGGETTMLFSEGSQAATSSKPPRSYYVMVKGVIKKGAVVEITGADLKARSIEDPASCQMTNGSIYVPDGATGKLKLLA